MGEPCGMPRRLSRASVVRVLLPRSSVSSTGHSSHILIRCSTRRSTTRRATDFNSSVGVGAGEAPAFCLGELKTSVQPTGLWVYAVEQLVPEIRAELPQLREPRQQGGGRQL